MAQTPFGLFGLGVRKRRDVPSLPDNALLLSIEPLIVHVRLTIFELIRTIPLDLPAPCTFLSENTWSLENNMTGAPYVDEIARMRARRPQDRFVLLANTPDEVDIARGFGVEAFFANHNMFVDEATFRPLAGEVVRFDAIYNANWRTWKRHTLARDIERLALVGYFFGYELDEQVSGYAQVRMAMAQATFCNVDATGHFRKLAPSEINILLAQSRVGLCLSAAEGAMLSSMEYLLAGLPIVSTPSVGGRDLFFDPDYCLIVDPDPRAIRDATAALIARDIPRDVVRRRTLERVLAQRARFIAFVQTLFDAAGTDRRFIDDWPRLFCPNLATPCRTDVFWEDVIRQLGGRAAARRPWWPV